MSAICPLMSKPDQNGNLQKITCTSVLHCMWYKAKNGRPSCNLITLVEDLILANQKLNDKIDKLMR